MKLLLCATCRDVVALQYDKRSCRCGAVWGRYRPDGAHADVSKDAQVIGLCNFTLEQALQGRHTMLNCWLFDPAVPSRVWWEHDPVEARTKADRVRGRKRQREIEEAWSA